MAGTKYFSKKIQTPDGKFDSKKEYMHWMKLKALQQKGFITDLRRQVEYELIPKQVINGRVAEMPCRYIADFVYKNEGIEVVEDVKSEYTRKLPEYVIKRKLMLYVHGIKVQEIVL